MHGRSQSNDHRPSHPYYAGTGHVAFFADQADIAGTQREAHREVFDESRGRVSCMLLPWSESRARRGFPHVVRTFVAYRMRASNGVTYFVA